MAIAYHVHDFLIPTATNEEASNGTVSDKALVPSNLPPILSTKQDLSTALTSIAGLSTSADQTIYATAENAYATTALTSIGRDVIGGSSAEVILGILGGGTTGIDVFQAETAADIRALLDLEPGTDVQAQSAILQEIADLTPGVDGTVLGRTGGAFGYVEAIAGDVFARTVDDRTALKALSTSSITTAILKEPGREGLFAFFAGDFSAEVTADTLEGVYIAADDTLSSAGAWRRLFVGGVFPEFFGAVGDGVEDDTAAVQAAIDYAESIVSTIGPSEVGLTKSKVDLGGKLYGLSDTLTINRAIVFENGSFIALSAPSTSTYLIDVDGESAEGAVIRNVDLDGGLLDNGDSTWTRYADLLRVNSPRVEVFNVTGIHFPSYGVRITSGSQECTVSNTSLREWGFTEAGTADGALRTARALSVEDADCLFTNVVCAQSLTPLYCNNPLNVFVGCHFYNGASTTTSEDRCALIDNTDNNVFVGCYFDNGRLEIKDSFNHTISGCHFQLTAAGTNTSAIFTDTSASNETVPGLIVSGCMFNGNFSAGDIAFGGSGTYIDQIFRQYMWVGNRKPDGTPAGKVEQLGNHSYKETGLTYLNASGNYFEFRGSRGILLSADYDANSSAAESKVTFATEGTNRFSIDNAGFLIPEADATYQIGSASNRLSRLDTLRVKTYGVTVANLPSASAQGAGTKAFVTDANATTFASIVAGGGSNNVPVYSDGTNWRIG